MYTYKERCASKVQEELMEQRRHPDKDTTSWWPSLNIAYTQEMLGYPCK